MEGQAAEFANVTIVTNETQALGKAKAGLEMGEVGIVIDYGVVFNGGALDAAEKVERAQLGSERRQFYVDELADAVER